MPPKFKKGSSEERDRVSVVDVTSSVNDQKLCNFEPTVSFGSGILNLFVGATTH